MVGSRTRRHSLAGLADLALGALPASSPQRGDGHVQAHAVVVLAAAGAEELVGKIPGAVAQRTDRLFRNWEGGRGTVSLERHSSKVVGIKRSCAF